MKFLVFALLVCSSTFASLYDHSLEKTNGEKLAMSSLKGKTVVLVNIATRCGYTGQLGGFETFYKEYKKKGVEVIGMPSDEFGGQTPEGNKEVAEFCRLKYGATFPILKKAKVTGKDKHPLIANLLAKTSNKEIQWNFEKFVISKKGQVTRLGSGVKPSSKKFLSTVNAALQ